MNNFCWTANRIAPCHLMVVENGEAIPIDHNSATPEELFKEAQEFKTKHPEWKVEVWDKKCHDDQWPFDVLHPEDLSTLVKELEPMAPMQECKIGYEGETVLLGERKEGWREKYE